MADIDTIQVRCDVCYKKFTMLIDDLDLFGCTRNVCNKCKEVSKLARQQCKNDEKKKQNKLMWIPCKKGRTCWMRIRSNNGSVLIRTNILIKRGTPINPKISQLCYNYILEQYYKGEFTQTNNPKVVRMIVS